MYHEIRASVLIEGKYSDSFPMREGVRQGCPASPLVFSLFADRVERFIAEDLAGELSHEQRNALRIAGVYLPMLLFADDLVLLSQDRAVVQQQLDALHRFCTENGLRVNVSKTKWFVGGVPPADSASEVLMYAGQPIERVLEFKYLGLVFTPEGSL